MLSKALSRPQNNSMHRNRCDGCYCLCKEMHETIETFQIAKCAFLRMSSTLIRKEESMENLLRAEEIYFINEYIVSSRKERIRWELGLERKRSDCIWKFAHRARDFLKPSLIHPVQIKNSELTLDGKCFRQAIGNPDVWILHPSDGWDRIQMGFQRAIDDYLGSGPYIMIDCKQTFAFIETESDCETHEFLYLHK